MDNGEISELSVFATIGGVFVGLKLCHVVDWPWLAVLSPFLLPVGFLIVTVILYLISDIMTKHDEDKE